MTKKTWKRSRNASKGKKKGQKQVQTSSAMKNTKIIVIWQMP